MIEKNSPAFTSSDTSLTAKICPAPFSAPPKVLLTFRNVRMAIGLDRPEARLVASY
jgi:hypothetical protein